MKKTVIGIFSQGNAAEEAKVALLENGIQTESIGITHRVEPEADRLTDGQMTSTQVQQAPIAEYTAGQETMLSVQVDEAEQVATVAGIIDNFGASDVNQFSVPDKK